MYQHNDQTFKELWCNNAEGEWKVEVIMKEWKGVAGRADRPDSSSWRIIFTAERVI
jgi:subtilisin-like proprotein convertase family protein